MSLALTLSENTQTDNCQIAAYMLIIVLAMSLFGCSSDRQPGPDDASAASGQQLSSEPAQRLDPYSSPLYAAQKVAPAQDFTAQLLNGETFQLSDQKGKVVLLNIWAEWCSPCHDETPEFVDLYNKYKEQGLVILGISIDERGKSVVQPFVEKYNVTYPMIIDDGSIMDKYGPTMGIPTSYIIDKKGNLRYFAVGPLTLKELTPRIEDLLEEAS